MSGSPNRTATSYDTEVRNRMEYVVRYIHDVRAGKWSAVVVPLWNLWAVEDLAREARHERIAQVCRQIEKRLRTVLPPQADENCERDLTVLLRAAQYVLDHAATVRAGEPVSDIPATLAEELGLADPTKAGSPVTEGLVLELHGVVATVGGGQVRVKLPELDSVHHQWSVVSALRRIQKKVSPNLNWSVDASALDELPVPIVNALVALGRDLRFQERELVVTGLDAHYLESSPIHEPTKLCATGEVAAVQPLTVGVESGLAICEV